MTTKTPDKVEPQLNHRGLLGIGAVVAFSLVVIVTVMTWMYIDLRRHEAELQSLINPTTAQFKQQLEKGLQRCLKEPECRRLFPGLRVHVDKKTHKRTITVRPRRQATPARHPGRAPVGHRVLARRPAARHPARRHRPPRTAPAHPGHPPTSPPNNPSPPPNPPPAPPPPVTLTVPLPIQVCSPAVQINKCPSASLVP